MTNEQEAQIFLARLDERYKALDEKLDTIILNQKNDREKTDGHEKDLHKLFNWKSEMSGVWKATIAIGAVISALISVICAVLFQNVA